MKSTKPSTGRALRAKSSKSAWERISVLLQSWRERIAATRREREKRRLRANRMRSIPLAEQLLAGLRQTSQYRGLLRQLQQRRQRRRLQKLDSAEAQPTRGPMAWLSPRAVELLSTKDAAMQLMRCSSSALLLISLISLALSAVPLRLTSPNWYMDVLANIGDTVPVLVLASVLSLLSLVFVTDPTRSTAYRRKLLRLSKLGYILALLLLPLQLGFMSWLMGDTYSNTRNQLNAARASSSALIDGAQTITSTEQFVAYLRSRNLNANLNSIAKSPLEQVKSEFIRSVTVQKQQEIQNISQNNFTLLLRFSINGVKLFATLAIFAFFLRVFWMLVKRSALTQPDSEELLGRSEPSSTIASY